MPTVDIDNLSAEDGVVVLGADSGDFLRQVSNVGDFNGDGIDDFIVGATGSDIGGPVNGAAFLVFGSENGFGSDDGLGRDVLDLGDLSASQGIIFTSDAPEARVALEVDGIGDVNGDGFSDIAVFDDDFNDGVGGVFVVFGNADALGPADGNGQEIINLENLTSEQGFVVSGGENASLLGFSIDRLGDINGDGYDDFGVTDPVAGTSSGVSYIIFGGEDNLGIEDENGVPTLNLSDLSASEGIRIIDTSTSSFFLGTEISDGGDFNGDGFNDIIITADFLEFPDENGAVFIIYGDENGLGVDDGSGGLIIDLATLSDEQGLILTGNPFENLFGREIDTIGDFNNDGFDDILIGDQGRLQVPGDAYIIFGGESVGETGFDGRAFLDVTQLDFTQGITVAGSFFNASLGGTATSAGDINGDGIGDVIIGNSTDGGPQIAFVLFGGQNFQPDEFNQSFALIEENTTAAYTALSLGEGTSYTLSGEDAELFTIDQATGLISFIDAPDFESVYDPELIFAVAGGVFDNDIDFEAIEELTFNLEVTAINGDYTSTEFVSVIVTDVNELGPEFQTSDTIILAEGGANSFFVFAIDQDTGNLTLDNSDDFVVQDLEYSITGGADGNLFELEVQQIVDNGNLVIYEQGLIQAVTASFIGNTSISNPADANDDGIYEIEITVSDGEFSTTQLIEVSLVDAGGAPEFVSPSQVLVDEVNGISRFSDLLTGFNVEAEDPEGADITYSVTGGPDGLFFEVDPITGRLISLLDINFDFPLDSNFNNIYEIEVTASDGVNMTSQILMIQVNDVDFAPSFFSSGRLSQEEGRLSFFQIDVADDGLDSVAISISGGEDSSLFEITNDAFSGQTFLNFLDAPDFETPLDSDGDNFYEVELTASDGVNVVTQLFTIEVTDAFETENAPVFVSPETILVDEGEASIVRVSAVDADGEIPTYTIIGGEDQFLFEIDRFSGELSFNSMPPRFNGPDDEDDNLYSVTIEASDGSSNVTTQDIIVEIVDVDVAPTIDTVAGLNIPENIFDIPGFSITFTAFNEYEDRLIELSIEGEDAHLFTLNPINVTSGFSEYELGFVQPLDFEMPTDADGDNRYEFEIIADDGVTTASQPYFIIVRDDLSDNAAAVSVFDVIFSNFSLDAVPDLQTLFIDAIQPEIGEVLPVSDIFELGQFVELEEIKSPTKDDFWTIKSVALQDEYVSNEVFEPVSSDDQSSVVEGDVFDFAVLSEFVDDVWM